MFKTLGWPELVVVLVIVLLVFGVGRISKIAGELGSGIRAFKDGLSGEGKNKDLDDQDAQSEDEES